MWVQKIKEQLECLISPFDVFGLELNHPPNTQVTHSNNRGSDNLPRGNRAPQTRLLPWFAPLTPPLVLSPFYLAGRAPDWDNKAVINNPLHTNRDPCRGPGVKNSRSLGCRAAVEGWLWLFLLLDLSPL